VNIVTWNCNGAFRKKYQMIASLHPDICVIQECENPNHVQDREFSDWARNCLWVGQNKHKGLGIFAVDSISLEQLNWQTRDVEFFLPCRVQSKFTIVGVWACKGSGKSYSYIGQVWQFLNKNLDHVSKGDVLLAGDFNSNAIWDKKRREGNHSDVVNMLDQAGISSLYHSSNMVPHGTEDEATFFLYRNPEKPYHIDYIFGSNGFRDNLASIQIGDLGTWLQKSDHLPMVAEFSIPNEDETS
jgi:endonuclease/exonuclease/phosphatase family metal-dependent hydrolase